MKRVPLLPTLIVGLAVALMVGLGLWQLLDRRPAKEAYLAQLAANPAKPPIAYPPFPDDRLLFRRATGFCLQVTGVSLAGAGGSGFRAIATCRTGAEGPGMIVQLGLTRDPMAHVAWRGGAVSGFLSHAPDSRPLIAGLVDRTPSRLMLVADRPVGGLSPNGRPDVSSVPNNHLAYAVQWFFFAAIAATIYAVALWRRARPAAPPPPERG